MYRDVVNIATAHFQSEKIFENQNRLKTSCLQQHEDFQSSFQSVSS